MLFLHNSNKIGSNADMWTSVWSFNKSCYLQNSPIKVCLLCLMTNFQRIWSYFINYYCQYQLSELNDILSVPLRPFVTIFSGRNKKVLVFLRLMVFPDLPKVTTALILQKRSSLFHHEDWFFITIWVNGMSNCQIRTRKSFFEIELRKWN